MNQTNNTTGQNHIDPDKIKRGDILLVHTKGSLISWLIRKFTKSYWNHVGIFVSKDNQWPKWVIEALGEGIVARPFEIKYVKVIRGDRGKVLQINPSKKFRIAIVRVKDLSYEQRKQISNKAYQWALEERRYDYLLLIIGMILHLLTFRILKPGWLNIKTRFICSELIATAFNEIAGISFGKYTASGYVTPSDIAKATIEQEKMEIVMSNA
jgi:cell wall-associated NlpC family hydrolase